MGCANCERLQAQVAMLRESLRQTDDAATDLRCNCYKPTNPNYDWRYEDAKERLATLEDSNGDLLAATEADTEAFLQKIRLEGARELVDKTPNEQLFILGSGGKHWITREHMLEVLAEMEKKCL